MKILLTVGLPASGKTYFSKEYIRNNDNVKHIEIDSYKKGLNRLETIILKEMNDEYIKEYILDGLFLTNESIINCLKLILDNTLFEDIIIDIHYWNENRKYCLWNDLYRREISSELTIRNALLEEIDLNYIFKEVKDKRINNINLITHNISKKDELIKDLDKLILDKKVSKSSIINKDNEIILLSKPWVINGYTHDRMGNKNFINPEEAQIFTELEDFLINLNENVSLKQYIDIRDNLVKIEEYEKNDYYSYYEYRRYTVSLSEVMKYLNS